MAGMQIGSRFTPPPTPKAKPNDYTAPNPGGFTVATGGGSPSPGTGPAPGSYAQVPGTAPIPGVTPTGVTWGVDPTGMATPYTPNRDPQSGGTSWSPGAGTNLYDQQMQRMMQMLAAFKGQMGGPVGMAREPGLTIAPGLTKTGMADRAPAEAAAFGRAKERLGKIASGAALGLKDQSTAAGRSGSGLESDEMQGISEGLQSALGEVVRDQTMDRLDRHDEIDDRNMGIDLNTRGQDIGQYATEYGGNIQQRGQDFTGAMNDPMRQMMMQMIPGFMSAINSFTPRF
jgi:hypothetical protein